MATPVEPFTGSTQDDVQKYVFEIVEKELNLPSGTVTREGSIMVDYEADSLDIVEIIMKLEDELEINLPDLEVERLRNAGDLADLCYAKRQGEESVQAFLATLPPGQTKSAA